MSVIIRLHVFSGSLQSKCFGKKIFFNLCVYYFHLNSLWYTCTIGIYTRSRVNRRESDNKRRFQEKYPENRNESPGDKISFDLQLRSTLDSLGWGWGGGYVSDFAIGVAVLMYLVWLCVFDGWSQIVHPPLLSTVYCRVQAHCPQRATRPTSSSRWRSPASIPSRTGSSEASPCFVPSTTSILLRYLVLTFVGRWV